MRVRTAIMSAVLIVAAQGVAAQPQCAEVGSSRIHACEYPGQGPTLVLAAGAGQDSRTWNPLVGLLSEQAGVVTFDRPGFGQSPAVDGPRTPTAIARELRSVLEHFEVSGPVVLVGHSMGGVHVLRYADLYPEDVAGVVLLDTPPPGFEEERLTLLIDDEREQRRRVLAEGRSRAPSMVGRERDGAAAEPWVFRHDPRERPLSVVVADHQDFGDLGSADAHRRLWVRQSSRWLSLSSNSEFVVAEGSGHMVHHDRTGLVLDVLTRMIDRERPPRLRAHDQEEWRPLSWLRAPHAASGGSNSGLWDPSPPSSSAGARPSARVPARPQGARRRAPVVRRAPCRRTRTPLAEGVRVE